MTDDQKPTALDRTLLDALTKRLKDLAGWATESLDDLIVRQVSHQSGTRPSRERPLEYNSHASDLATEVCGTLRTWAETICTTQHQRWPGEQRIQGWADWILDHIHDLARLDDCMQAFDEITDTHRRVLTEIDIPMPPEFVGPCQSDIPGATCEGVYCPRGKETFDCGTCGIPIDIPSVKAATAEALAGKLFTRTELRTALTVRCTKPPSRATIDRWIRKGLIPDRGGRYLLDDALALIRKDPA